MGGKKLILMLPFKSTFQIIDKHTLGATKTCLRFLRRWKNKGETDRHEMKTSVPCSHIQRCLSVSEAWRTV